MRFNSSYPLTNRDSQNTPETRDNMSSMKVEGIVNGGQGNGNAYLTYPDEPWNLRSYFKTVKGLENLLIYIWIAKDIAWTTSSWYPAWLFGTLAVILSGAFVFKAILDLHYDEIWNGVGQFLWVFGNFWWMMGDVHDVEFPDEKPQYDERQQSCQIIMSFAMAWLGVLYFIIRPFKLFPTVPKEIDAQYNDMTLVPSFPYFTNWREYENFHLVLWLGKDLAWCLLNKPMWFIFTPPTLLIALDFIFITATVDGLIIDHVHYISLLMWVIGNGTWALGELYWINNDDPETLFRGSRPENANARWWASWILLFSYLPLLIVHIYWIPLSTCTDIIPDHHQDSTPYSDVRDGNGRSSENPLHRASGGSISSIESGNDSGDNNSLDGKQSNSNSPTANSHTNA